MYADKEEAGTNKSVKDRLNGNTSQSSTRRSSISGKRGREDDHKWKHDLFENNGPKVSNRRTSEKDLRFKLQKKSIQPAAQSVKESLSGGVRDLREKLSGIVSSDPMEIEPPRQKQKSASEVSKRLRKSVNAEARVTETTKVASSVSKRKTQQKAESVDSFLQSLGLDKYSITFQAEEVDMATLIHMNDDDLKAMGVPMGPRKKILLAIESKV